MAFLSIPLIFFRAAPAIPSCYSTPSAYHFLQPEIRNQYSLQLKPSSRLNLSALCTSYEVGAGFLAEEFGAKNGRMENHGPEIGDFDSSQYEVLLKGGEQVTSVLEEMAKLVCFPLIVFYSFCLCGGILLNNNYKFSVSLIPGKLKP